jgi:ketosteroid isomerase-like protein
VAWAAADATFSVEMGGQQMAFPVRFTGVLEKRSDKWLVVQAHFSLPANQDAGSSVPN